jgi:hypothetical protein
MADCYVQTDYWDAGYTDQDVCEIAARPRGDDAFRSTGAREGFWRAKAEEWLEDQLEEAREAVQEGEKAEFAAEIGPKITVALMQWPEFAPAINAVQRLAAAMKVEEPDPAIWTLIAAVELQRKEMRLARKRRDEDALMRIMGWM